MYNMMLFIEKCKLIKNIIKDEYFCVYIYIYIYKYIYIQISAYI